MTDNVEHLFTCLFAIYISPLVGCLLRSLGHSVSTLRDIFIMCRISEWWLLFQHLKDVILKQLLIASSGHQAPRKAAHCLQREVGQGY